MNAVIKKGLSTEEFFKEVAKGYKETASAMAYPDDSDENWRYSQLKNPQFYDLEQVPRDLVKFSNQDLLSVFNLKDVELVQFSSGLAKGNQEIIRQATQEDLMRLKLFEPTSRPDLESLAASEFIWIITPVKNKTIVIDNRHDVKSTKAGLRVLLEIKDNVSAKIIEIISGEQQLSFYGLTYEVTALADSTLQYVRVDNSLGSSLTNFFVLQKDLSLVTVLNTSLGDSISRFNFNSWLEGQKAQSNFYSVSVKGNSAHYDLRTRQEHIGYKTISEMKSANVLSDSAESVYVGLIKMRKGCKKSSAIQANKSLLLSKQAHADSVPNLDIEENDVRCDHASAVGPIDPMQLEYLQGRRVPIEKAIGLIASGFAMDVLEKASDLNGYKYLVEVIKERFKC
jgi:hypothetical protein